MGAQFQLLSNHDKRADRKDRAMVGQARLFEVQPAPHRRPETRADCQGFESCPYVGCRHNTVLEVKRAGKSGDPQIFGQDEDIWDGDVKSRGYADRVYDASCPDGPDVERQGVFCALHAIDDRPDGMTQDEVAEAFGTTRMRISQLESSAIRSIAPDLAAIACEMAGIDYQRGPADELYEDYRSSCHDPHYDEQGHRPDRGSVGIGESGELAGFSPGGVPQESFGVGRTVCDDFRLEGECEILTYRILKFPRVGGEILEAVGQMLKQSPHRSNFVMGGV